MCVSDSPSPTEQLALQLRRHLFLLFQQLFLTAFPLLSRRTPCLLGCSLTKHGVHTLGVVHMFTPHTKHSVWVEQTWSRQIWLLRAASQALKSGPVKRGDVVVDACSVKRNVVKTVHRGLFVFWAFLFLRECPIVFIEWERWHRDTSHSCSLCCFFFTGYHREASWLEPSHNHAPNTQTSSLETRLFLFDRMVRRRWWLISIGAFVFVGAFCICICVFVLL